MDNATTILTRRLELMIQESRANGCRYQAFANDDIAALIEAVRNTPVGETAPAVGQVWENKRSSKRVLVMGVERDASSGGVVSVSIKPVDDEGAKARSIDMSKKNRLRQDYVFVGEAE